MLTARGWWFLIVAMVLLMLGVLAGHAALCLIGFTLVFWFGAIALVFVFRTIVVVPRVGFTREVRDDRGPVEALWAGRTFGVRVVVKLNSPFGLPHAAASDWVPFGVSLDEGDANADGPLNAERPLEIAYRVRCPSVGRARFEGVRLRLSDLHGFFYHYTFVRGERVLRVLPALTDDRGQSVTTKLHNLLPPPGIHRLRRPGGGSELLDLRDYMPGDPPKTIAWKVSARRDKLITKEFESDVPLRCTLFVDASTSVRLGPPGKNALSRTSALAAAVAQANAGNRDLTGLCLFDEESIRVIRPARTPRHLTELLNVLADAACRAPAAARTPAEPLVPLAYAFVREVYPGWLRSDVNAVPFWLPSLWPVPAEAARPPSLLAASVRWLWWLVSLVPVALLVLLSAVSMESVYELIPEPILVPPSIIFLFEILGLMIFYPKLLEIGRGFVTMLFAWGERRQSRWRKQLAAVLSVRYGLSPGGLSLLMENDELMSRYLQRFLAEHDVPYRLPLYDDRGRYRHALPAKVEVLGKALLSAVGKGHDNELFVLMVDLLDLEEQLGPLLKAVKVALARHHAVVVIAPWPPGVAPPTGPPPDLDAASPASVLLDLVTERHYHAAFQRVRRAFARLGVPVVSAADGEPVQLVLNRMDRLRLVGRRR